ncbi:MAG: TonB-dependent receptor [Terriglobia bacterium]
MNRLLRRAGLLGLLLVLGVSGAAWLQAQTISGIIAGTVRDQQGTLLGAVSITVTNPATGRVYVDSTDEQGYFRIPEIAPGVYEVMAEFSGFQTVRHVGVRVSVNRVTVEDFVLEIPPQVQVVEVSSEAPMTDTTGPTISMSFPDRQVSELPILTRDINNLALLAPGVSSVRTFSFASTLVPFAANGSRGRDNNFIIDSVDNNEPLFGGAATQFTNTDIFAEYTILTHQLKAEFGRNSGATVNVITKGGSNRRHGSLFWFTQHDELNARSRVEKAALLGQPATFYENQIGFTLGGALKQDSAFYFISYQWDRARNNLSNTFPVVSTLPTAAGLSTLFGLPQTAALQTFLARPTVVLIPGRNTACFGAPAPTGFSTVNPCLLSSTLVGANAVPFNTFLVDDANLFDVRDHQFSLRLDKPISNTDDFYGRYLFDDLKTPRFPLAPTGETAFSDLGLLPEWRTFLLQRTQSMLLNERHYWVNALNEFRFSFSRISQRIGSFGVDEASREGLAAAVVTDAFGGFGQFTNQFPATGTRFTLGRDSRPTRTDSNIFQVQDNFSYNRGRHAFKFGLNYVRTQSNIRNLPSDLGQYFFGGGGTGGAGFDPFITEGSGATSNALAVFQRFPNVITDGAGNIIGQGQDSLPLREFDQFYFFQDTFRIRPNFTLSYGLRYENYSQPINRIRRLNPAGPRVERDDNNFAPRIGFAWSPRESTVLRGGYAVMYNPMVLNIPLLLWQSGPISPFVATDTPAGAAAAPFAANSVIPVSGFYPNQPLTLADINVLVAGCSTFDERRSAGAIPLINCSNQEAVDPDLVNPYVQTFSLTLQQELSSTLMMEIGWVGSKGTKLFQRVDENPLRGWDQACIQTGGNNPVCLLPRLDDTRGSIARVTNSARSTYHALQISLNKRLTRSRAGDFAFTAAYTWSHMIDTASEIFGPGVRFLPAGFVGLLRSGLETVEAITPLAQDPFNLQAEKGNSAFDRRHRLAISYLWAPLPTKGPWLGGWELNGIITLQSGQPFSPLNGLPLGDCADANGDGRLTNDRADIGNPNAPANTVALLADPLCVDPSRGFIDLAGNPVDPSTTRFVQVPLGRVGTAGRNILTGPGIVNFDFSFFKNFRWGEGKNIQFRWEFFDLFNTSNPGFGIGNVFATDAQPTPAFAFSPRRSAAGVTGVVPENAIDADDGFGGRNFLSRAFMNTSNRRMQIGIKFIF